MRFRPPPSYCHGLTLIELIFSLCVTSLLIAALGSTMLLAGKALPGTDNPATALIQAANVTRQLTQDLQYATDINTADAHQIIFNVADRNHDGTPESICYQWSGTTGDPLTEQINDGQCITLLKDVQDFSLSYDTLDTTTQEPNMQTSGTSLLTSYVGSNNLSSLSIKNGQWICQTIKPTLPEKAAGWSLAYMDYYIKHGLLTVGSFTVQIQKATAAGYPSGVVLAEQTILEADLLPGFQLSRLTFSGVTGLDPDQGLCVLFIWDSGLTNAGSLQVDTGDTGASVQRQCLISKDDGVSWSLQSNTNLRFYLYGTVTDNGNNLVSTSRTLNSVAVTLSTSDQSSAALQTRIHLVNQPEILP